MIKILRTLTFELLDRFSLATYRLVQFNKRKNVATYKHVENFILGEQPGNLHEKIPRTITFKPFTQFQQTDYQLIQLNKWKNVETSRRFQISFYRSNWQLFIQKIHLKITFKPLNLLVKTLCQLIKHEKCQPQISHLIPFLWLLELAKQQILLAKNFSVYSQL
jgi:hypothetical protein